MLGEVQPFEVSQVSLITNRIKGIGQFQLGGPNGFEINSGLRL